MFLLEFLSPVNKAALKKAQKKFSSEADLTESKVSIIYELTLMTSLEDDS